MIEADRYTLASGEEQQSVVFLAKQSVTSTVTYEDGNPAPLPLGLTNGKYRPPLHLTVAPVSTS